MKSFDLGDNKSLVEFIRKTRLRRGIGLRELARIVDCPASNLCSIEKGRVHLSDKLATRLLKSLGMTVQVVVTEQRRVDREASE